jgi:hypothetical protein
MRPAASAIIAAKNMLSAKSFDARMALKVALLCMSFVLSAVADDMPRANAGSPLDRGFSGLYNLDFVNAQKDFSLWQRLHPDDPVGPVSEAAGWIFSEFNRLGVLEAQFFENDDKFAARTKLKADPAIRERFQNAINRAQSLSQARLAKNPTDLDALFALTLAAGLQADYAALIDKRNMESLHYTKEASNSAQRLLSICHNCYDALLATGFTKYILGSMAAPVRWVLRLGGLPADKQAGIEDLETTAERGHYLAPFARILLAIAFVREKDNTRALEVLTQLRSDYPANTLVAREIVRLQSSH